MKFFISFALVATLALVAADHEIRIVNNCAFTIWPGLLNNPGKTLPEDGGFKLDANNTRTFNVSDSWIGRIWARTNCDSAGKCETGDCGKYFNVVYKVLFYNEIQSISGNFGSSNDTSQRLILLLTGSWLYCKHLAKITLM